MWRAVKALRAVTDMGERNICLSRTLLLIQYYSRDGGHALRMIVPLTPVMASSPPLSPTTYVKLATRRARAFVFASRHRAADSSDGQTGMQKDVETLEPSRSDGKQMNRQARSCDEGRFVCTRVFDMLSAERRAAIARRSPFERRITPSLSPC